MLTEELPDRAEVGVRSATKRALLTLSHAMERAFDSVDLKDVDREALVIALFQRRAYFEVERKRYEALAARGATVIVGFAVPVTDLPDGVHGISFEPDDPLAKEWALVLLDGPLGTALVALDEDTLVPNGPTLEASRCFSARWTFHRVRAIVDARRLLRLLGPDLPSGVVAAADQVITRSAAHLPDPSERRLAAAAETLVNAFPKACTTPRWTWGAGWSRHGPQPSWTS